MLTQTAGWKKWSVVAAGLLLLIVVASVASRSRDAKPRISNNQNDKDTDTPEEVLGVDIERVVIGGVERPSSDVRLLPSQDPSEKQTVMRKQGFSPAIAPDASDSVAQLASELQARQNPSAFSSFAPPERFDAEAYKANPERYLTRIEPARVFAPAQPGDQVPPIRPAGKRYHRVVQGESVRLRVESTAGFPVTFASQDLGQFDNQLSSITVAANEQGIAEAVYTASGGTVDLVQILAASPVASGQVNFTIDVAIRE